MAKSRRLVIDADVLKASGDINAIKPRAARCRDFLTAVRSLGHQVVASNEIIREWKNHPSRFASKWRVQMHGRKGIVFPLIHENPSLRARISKHAPEESITLIILKDVHLIDAALATDNRIVSMDKRAFNHLRKLASHLPEIHQLALVNPEVPDPDPVQWLKDGAPLSEQYKLLRPDPTG